MQKSKVLILFIFIVGIACERITDNDINNNLNDYSFQYPLSVGKTFEYNYYKKITRYSGYYHDTIYGNALWLVKDKTTTNDTSTYKILEKINGIQISVQSNPEDGIISQDTSQIETDSSYFDIMVTPTSIHVKLVVDIMNEYLPKPISIPLAETENDSLYSIWNEEPDGYAIYVNHVGLVEFEWNVHTNSVLKERYELKTTVN